LNSALSVIMASNTTTNQNNNKKKYGNATLVANYVAVMLVCASYPGLISAHRWGGSCGGYDRYSYPRRYGYHNRRDYHHWGGGCGPRSCHSRRGYGYSVFDILDGLFFHSNSWNNRHSRIRQERRSAAPTDEPRYAVEDFGRSDLEVSIEVPAFLTARDIDLEIIRENGTSTISVYGNTGRRFRRYGSVENSSFSCSFVIDDDGIDVDNSRASLSSGILTISLPNKRKRRRRSKRVIPSVLKNEPIEDAINKKDNRIPVNSKKGITSNAINKKRARGQPISIDNKNVRDSFDDLNSTNRGQQSQEGDDLYISEEEDIW